MFLDELGTRLRDARLKKSMSQTRLAELVGYKDKTAISHIESGKRDIPQSKLVAIAEALDVSVSYLLDGEKYYNDDTAEKALELLKDPNYRVLTEFMILSGVRIGEALDLKKKDIDLKKRQIYVHTTYSTVSKKSSSTKTKASERVIFIQDELKDCIVRVRALYHSKDPYLFEFGDLRSAYFSYNKYFKENTEKLLGRKLTPHCLRHTHTSLMAENGVPLSQISRRLGHGPNSKVTEQVYLHVTNKMIKTENDRIRKLTLIG